MELNTGEKIVLDVIKNFYLREIRDLISVVKNVKENIF